MHISSLADSMPISSFNKSLLIAVVFCINALSTVAQPLHSDLLKKTYLEYVTNLPKYLLTTKSAVVLIAPNRNEVTLMAQEIHPYLVKSGIDAVAYYHVDDLFINDELSQKLSENLDKREIKYIIVIEKQQGNYCLIITAHEEQSDFVKAGNKAWKMERKSLSDIGKSLYSLAYSMERKNYLIIDIPEFPPLDIEVKGRRYEAYRPDLKSEKLAIRYFAKLDDPDSLIVNEDADKVRQYIRQRNTEIDALNKQLEQQFANYPYPYELVDASISDKELNDKELRYVLQNVHSTNKECREALGYSEKTEVTEYVSVSMNNGQGSINRIPANEIVYKYYVCHIPSSSLYLGTKWDADASWGQALQNYLQLMKAEID